MLRTSAFAIVCLLSLAGCGSPDEVIPQGPGGLLAADEESRVEPPVVVDPALETPHDPIWRELWLPIDNHERADTQATQIITRFVAPRPGLTIANVGAGGGFYDFRWSPLVGPTGFIYAIDVDRRMTRKISYEIGSRGVDNIRPIQVARGHIGLEPGSVDVVTFLDTGAFSTCHPGHNPSYFRQSAEALRPGGRLVIFNDVDSGETQDVHAPQGEQRCRMLSADDLIALAAPHFTLVSQETVNKGTWHAFGLLFERLP